MRETVRSMRAYLILVGVFGGFSELRSVLRGGDAVLTLLEVLGLLLCGASLYAGVRLPSLLRERLSLLIGLLCVGIGVAVSTSLYAYRLAPSDYAFGGMIARLVMSTLIGLYLIRSAKRLAAELTKPS
jgi:hypothetical protein